MNSGPRPPRRLITWSVGVAVLIAATCGSLAAFGHQRVPPSWVPTDHTIIVAGDVILGRDVEREVLRGVNPFAGMEPVLRRAGAVVVNLESPFTDSRKPLEKDIVLKARPESAEILTESGVTAVTLANNHVSDFQPDGLFDTLATLADLGIATVGAGGNIEEATTPLQFTLDDQRIAVVNFSRYNTPEAPAAGADSPGQAYYGTPYFEMRLKEARANSDYVIAILHHGEEYEDYPTDAQIDISRKAIEFGADVAISHHPHITQGIEYYLGKPIFYSIGNFVFDQETEPWDRSFFVAIDPSNGQADFTLYPYVITKGVPEFMTEDDANSFFAHVNNISPRPLVTVEQGLGHLPPSIY